MYSSRSNAIVFKILSSKIAVQSDYITAKGKEINNAYGVFKYLG